MITKYRERKHQAAMLYWGPDFMDPHSNAKAFAYNANNAQDAYAATTTWRNSWAVPEELNTMTRAALAESDPAKREAMYLELQKIIQAKSPIMIMFQASYQVGMNNAVTGYVNGATSDFVFYRLVEKN
jgi:peptide/nickel transport system substrate-binding protein